uniref:Protogenin-like n=1 Tax=Crassostrea virginica TaxID=6565 RepID=A0A8B8BT35_CRAVI|nr:protogenin-like [Crassostrea virginica]
MDSLWLSCYVCVVIFGTLSSCRAESTSSSESKSSHQMVIVAQKNSPLLVNCSDPSLSWINESEVKFKWFKDGRVMTPDSKRISVSQNGSLYFQSIKRKKRRGMNDEGFYECHKTFTSGTVIAKRVEIQIARISKTFIKDPQDQQAVKGGVARFECQVEATPSQVKYIWNKDGQQLTSDNRYTELPSGVLQIYDVQDSDKGAYSCSALNTFADAEGALPSSVLRHSKEAVLTVLNPTSDSQNGAPKMVAVSAVVNATKGGSAILECLVEGVVGSQIAWHKMVVMDNGTTIVEPVEDGFRVRRIGLGNLKFTKVMESDQGVYRCLAVSTKNRRNNSGQTILNVNYPPKLLTLPSSGDHPVVKRTRLHCVAQGHPTPTITWFHNGKKMKEDAGHIIFKQNNEQLVFENRVSDSGFYQCIAENPYGSQIATAQIRITLGKNAPSPPSTLMATPVSDTQITLTWGSACCNVFVYTVHYNWITPDTQEEQSEQLVIQSNTCNVTQLLPYTTYHFYVRAYNSNGSSEASKIVDATTLQSVPRAAPKIRTDSLRVGSITLNWSPLLASESRGAITRYRIYYHVAENISIQMIEIHNNTNTYTITGLLPDQLYRVRVLAGTEVGYPTLPDHKWPWVSERTLSKDSPSTVIPAPHLEATPLSDSSVKVSWEVSNTSKEVTGFRLHVNRRIGPAHSRLFKLQADATSHVVNSLENRIYYEAVLEVQGENETLGRSSLLFQALSPSSTPEPPPPMDVRVFAKSPHSLSLNWTRPHWTEGIAYYTVCYHIKDDYRKIMYERSDSQNHTLQDLHPYTTYTVSVRSHSPLTTGPFGTPQNITTLEDVPSPPEDVTLYPLSEGQVKLKWNPPTKKNGVIIFYIIQYHPHQDDPEFLWSSIHSNGTVTQAVVRDLTNTIYYFKLRACTTAGQGPPSNVVKVVLSPCVAACDGRNSSPPISSPTEGSDSFLQDQRLGIVIGCAIGLTSIIVCILVIVLRQRHYANLYQHSTRMVTHPDMGYRYQHQGFSTPEARRMVLMERQNKDRSSPSAYMSCNGKLLALSSTDRHSDRQPTEAEQEPGENACLLWHQQALHHAHSDGNQSLSNDSGASLSCDIRGVSPESSSERHADSTWGSTRVNNLSGEASEGAVAIRPPPPGGHNNSPEWNARGDNLYNDCGISHSDELLKKMLQATSAELNVEPLSSGSQNTLTMNSPNHAGLSDVESPDRETASRLEQAGSSGHHIEQGQVSSLEPEKSTEERQGSMENLSRSADFVSRSVERGNIC